MFKVLGGAWIVLAAAIAQLASNSAFAQGVSTDDPALWPNRPVKIIVTTATGQASDLLARILSQNFAKAFGQPFLVENRSGAGGQIGLRMAAKSPANGYTLVTATSGPMTIAPAVNANTPFDPVKDFAPIANIVVTPQLVLVGEGSPYKTLADLLAAAKQADLAFATSTIGSTSHLAYEVLIKAASVKFNLVPFRGNAEAAARVMNGDIAAMFDTVPGALTLIKGRRLRPLAVAGPHRSPFLPEVRTLSEQGINGVDAVGWVGLAAPAGTSPIVLNKLNDQIRLMLAASDIQQTLQTMAFAPAQDTSRPGFASLIRSELARWTKVARDGNIKAD